MSKIIMSVLFATFVGLTANATVDVVMKTSMGDIEIALDDVKAPKTVKNFMRYTDKKFYDGTVFHRVIKNFMIQGGGFNLVNGSLSQKKTLGSVKNEAKNGLKNNRGTIAMARTSDPHSATAQFFINHKNNANLDHPSFDGWGYAVFGKVTKGMDVVDKIAAVQTSNNGGMGDVPKSEVKIISVSKKAPAKKK